MNAGGIDPRRPTTTDPNRADTVGNAAIDLARTLLAKFPAGSSDRSPVDDDAEREDDVPCREVGGKRVEAPDVIGAVVLLAHGLVSSPGLLDRLATEVCVVILEVANADWIAPALEAVHAWLDVCSASARPGTDRGGRSGPRRCGLSDAIVVAAKLHGSGGSEYAERRTARAFREHRTLIGIATNIGRGLPKDLVAASQVRIRLAGFDPVSAALVVERVAGNRPTRSIPDEVAAALVPGDLKTALHPARGADGCVDRLVELVTGRLRAAAGDGGPRLQDLAGYGSALEWGLSTAADLAAYAKGELGWSECEPAILLAGPPGTGKTMFAGALARQAELPILDGSLAQWQSDGEAHLGTTLAAMRRFFDAAGKAAPCVALIDEVDSFGDRRQFADQHRQYSTQIVNGFLECLDGIGRRDGVVLVGTTNAAHRIDPAILRSGRFDRVVRIELPSTSDLAAILRHHLGSDLGASDLRHVAVCRAVTKPSTGASALC